MNLEKYIILIYDWNYNLDHDALLIENSFEKKKLLIDKFVL